MFGREFLILAFGWALIVSSAEARPKGPDFGPPMRILIVRGEGPECPTKCPEWISLEGAFVKETPALFRKALEQIGARKPQVLVSSGGGIVDAAMEMGRMLRAKGLEVSVARTIVDAPATNIAPDKTSQSAIALVDGGRPSVSGAFCASACPLLLAAGKARHVALYARVGLHKMVVPEHDETQHVRYFKTRTLMLGDQVISKETRVVGEQDVVTHIGRHSTSEEDYRKVAAYLDEMGLPSAKVVEFMHKASPEGMVWMSRQGLADTLLATDAQTPEAALGLAPKVVAPAPAAEASAASDSGFSLTFGQLAALGVIALAMFAALLVSLRRGGWQGGAARRRDPPPLS